MYNVEIKQPICDDHSIWICFNVYNVLINIKITVKCLWFVTKMITFISNLIFLYQYALERLDVSQFAKFAEFSSHHIHYLDSRPVSSIETPCLGNDLGLGIDTWIWKDNPWSHNYIGSQQLHHHYLQFPMTHGPHQPPWRLRQECFFISPSLPSLASVQEAYMGPLQSYAP